jgi:hypothetical protein
MALSRPEVRRVDERLIGLSPKEQFSVQFLPYDQAFSRSTTGWRARQDHPGHMRRLPRSGFELGRTPSPDGSAELSNIKKELEEITFRLGSADLADHTLVVGERRFRLLDTLGRDGFVFVWRLLCEDKPEFDAR